MSGKRVPLSELNLNEYEERDLTVRSNVEAELAAIIESGEGCAFEWNSQQVSKANEWNEANGSKLAITQLGTLNTRKQKVRNGKTAEVTRFKRNLIAVRPAPTA